MLVGAGQAGVGDVEIDVESVFELGGDGDAGKYIDMLEGVDQPREVVEIDKRRGSVPAAFEVDGVDRLGPRGIVDAAAAQIDIVAVIAPLEAGVAINSSDDILDQGGGKMKAARSRRIGIGSAIPMFSRTFNAVWWMRSMSRLLKGR